MSRRAADDFVMDGIAANLAGVAEICGRSSTRSSVAAPGGGDAFAAPLRQATAPTS